MGSGVHFTRRLFAFEATFKCRKLLVQSCGQLIVEDGLVASRSHLEDAKNGIVASRVLDRSQDVE